MISKELREKLGRAGMWWHKIPEAQDLTLSDVLSGLYILYDKDEDFVFLRPELPDKKEENRLLLMGQFLTQDDVPPSDKNMVWWCEFIESFNAKHYFKEKKEDES